MRRQNLLLVVSVALAWGGLAAAQGTPQGGARPTSSAQNQAAPPANNAGTLTPGTRTPVNQPSTMPGAQTPVNQPSTSAPSSGSMPQQTIMPNQPNSASRARDTDSATRARTGTQSVVPPASRGVGTTANLPDCSQKRGLEKSEGERRDTVRDDLPAGVTTTQQPKPPQ